MNAQLLGDSGHEFRYIATDTRRISFPADTIFFALITARRNGHQFVADAYEQGVRLFVVSETPDAPIADATYLIVGNTLQALQQLAAWHRSRLQCEVVGITGSNGKTIVKEWLFELLAQEEQIVRSPKSFNSQIGVPLSVWMLQRNTTLGIIEAGISQPGEMQALQKIIQPTIGLFTMLGDAHNTGFHSMQQKLEEKFLLFENCAALIVRTDDEAIKKMAQTFKGKLLNWSRHEDAWLRVSNATEQGASTTVELQQGDTVFSITLPFIDRASLENAMHCVAFMLHRGYDIVTIQARMQQLQHLDMRLQWNKAINDCYILNDSYSNDFTSLIQAIEYLHHQSRNNKRTIILSDLSVATGETKQQYKQLAALLTEKHIDRLIGIGPGMKKYMAELPASSIETLLFDNTNELLQEFAAIRFSHEDILLKGGRNFELERVARLLEAQQHQTVLEIHLSAIAHNLQYYRSFIQPSVKLMVMVKAFGYGSGDAEIARAMQFNGVEYLAVAYVDEGITLRKAGVHMPVMVLNTDPASFNALEQYNLEPEVYSFDFLQTLLQWCRHKGISNMPIHVKVDTGMHRLGFDTAEIPDLAQLLSSQQELVVKSAFTHLVASEDAGEDDFTRQQVSAFSEACTTLQQTLGYSFLRHAANTAAISRHAHAHFDMVRLGVGLYGGLAGQLPVMKLKTTVAQVKRVKAGETVGYGRSGLLHRDSIIATVRIGYADGYPRNLSNGIGHMYLHGRQVPVVGKVCMDMTMLDVTEIPQVKVGDIVEVFGDHIGIQQVAGWSQTITYEIMTGISQRVKRVYIDG